MELFLKAEESAQARYKMMSSHEALYRAICAHPDEDTPRLAFADLIEEEGEYRRGAFIRTQIALARVPEYDAVHVTARQHDPDAATGWCMTESLPKMPSGCGWHRFEFRRGFPWRVGVLSLSAFVANAEEAFAAAPIQAIDIDQRDRPTLALLADWPSLARLQQLTFSTGWFGVADIIPLAESAYATNLTSLAFEFESLAPDGLTALAASPLFGRLKSLELHSNVIPAALMVDSLAAAREPGALARLAMPYNRIGRADAPELFALPTLRELQHLDMCDNPLGAEGVLALAESGIVRGLRVLKLSGTRPGVRGVKALTEAGGFAGVRLLDLSANALGPVALKALCTCDGLRGLRVLNLANNHVGDFGAADLSRARSLAGLLELDLREADVSDAGAIALAESPHLDNLLRLDLRSHRSFGKRARAALIARFGDRVCL